MSTSNQPRTSGAPPAWDAAALRDPHHQADKAARVQSMFDAVAPAYERVNTVASLGRDAAWRRRTIAAADIRPTDVALDLCCGTGDMVRALATHDPAPARVIGLDFSSQMLRHGRYDGIATPIALIRGDALRLPLRDASVDIVTCAFGVRNFAELQLGLCEMHRVLRPGGRALILEFANPENVLLRWGFRIYCEQILPRVAAFLSPERTNAYKYLARSIQSFETATTITARLRDAGFVAAATTHMNLGGVVLFRGLRR